MNIDIVQLPKDKRKSGIFHVQHLNSLHNITKFLRTKFRDITTKYLVNYMYCSKWQEYFKTDNNIIKCRHLMVYSYDSHINSRVKEFVLRKVKF